jgi:NADH dehydrogenase/NADH:ubiquinone oxidoreductase subunit G
MEKKNVKVIVNGNEMLLPEGAPLLQALIDEKVEVPHFCYHPGIGIEGSCRLCLVEVVGMPKLATSCTVPVKEGMQVNTSTPAVDKARKGVLEFFLINHPLDCPFCDKGGECPLQNYTVDAQQDGSRYEFAKEEKDKHVSIGEHIMLDKERCVLCNRCVRFGRNLGGKEELSIQHRGHHAEIFIPEGKQLSNAFTGNLADICPVGALTTKEFRFKARPWELKTTQSLCGCSVGCNVDVWIKNKKLLRLTPRINPEVNEWWLSDSCRFGIHNMVADENRVIQPLNNGAPASETSWATELTQELRKQSTKLGFVVDANLSNEEFFTVKSLAKTLKAKVYAPVSAELRKIKSVLASKGLEGQFPTSLEASDNIVVIGERLEEDHGVVALRVRRLFHAFKKNILTISSNSKSQLKDIWAKHTVSSAENLTKDFANLNLQGSTTVLLSYRWVNEKTLVSIQQWADRLPSGTKVFLLLEGANAQGMIDQWDDAFVASHADLERDVSSGKIQAIVQFGNSFKTEKNIWTAQFIYSAEQAAKNAAWVLPYEYFTEKAGTYTNTFGNVQRLHRSRRVFKARAFDTINLLESMLKEFGQHTTKELSNVYANMASDLKGYPKALTEIKESNQTYTHYERAQWR